MSEQTARIGVQLRLAREHAGLTQKQLATAAGVANGTVNAIEQGRSVRPSSLVKVREYLGVTFTQPSSDPLVETGVAMVEKFLTAARDDEDLRRRLVYLAGTVASYGARTDQ